MTYENFIKGRIVQFAVNEAWCYGGVDCMCAVAQVIANRVKAGWGEWNKVIDDAPQHAGTDLDEMPVLDHRDAMFRQMLAAVDGIYHGTAEDLVSIEDDRGFTPALYYADLNQLNRAWFRENITGKIAEHPRLATVGQLTFFG
jgi:hypothetical protein